MVLGGRRRRAKTGFTLLECLVAMFILLMGLVGVVSVFQAGMQARLMAQEMIVSQELATLWSEWVRFRVAGGAFGSALSPGALGNATGDFFTGSSSIAGAGNFNLPTAGCSAYRGYTWSSTCDSGVYGNLTWLPDDLDPGGTTPVTPISVNKTANGGSTIPFAYAAGALHQVELSIMRGGHCYKYSCMFSGVPVRYGKL